jgi:hypothetical protein
MPLPSDSATGRPHRLKKSIPGPLILCHFPVKPAKRKAIIFPFHPIKCMKRIFSNPIDLSKVDTLIYHLPDGPTLSVEMDGLGSFFDFDMEIGDICDTSDIDGVVHFFPKGNA